MNLIITWRVAILFLLLCLGVLFLAAAKSYDNFDSSDDGDDDAMCISVTSIVNA